MNPAMNMIPMTRAIMESLWTYFSCEDSGMNGNDWPKNLMRKAAPKSSIRSSIKGT